MMTMLKRFSAALCAVALLTGGHLLAGRAAATPLNVLWTLYDLPGAGDASDFDGLDAGKMSLDASNDVLTWTNEAIWGGGGRGTAAGSFGQLAGLSNAYCVYSPTDHTYGGVVCGATQGFTVGQHYDGRSQNNTVILAGYFDYTLGTSAQNIVLAVNGSNGAYTSELQPEIVVNKTTGPAGAVDVRYRNSASYNDVTTPAGSAAAGWHVVIIRDKNFQRCISIDDGAESCTAGQVFMAAKPAGVTGSLGAGGQPITINRLYISSDHLTDDQLQRAYYVVGKRVGLAIGSPYTAANPPMIASSARPSLTASQGLTALDDWHGALVNGNYLVAYPPGMQGNARYIFPGPSAEKGIYILTAKSSTTFSVTSPKGEALPDATTGVTYSNAQITFIIYAASYNVGDTFNLWPSASQAQGVPGALIGTPYTPMPDVSSWPIADTISFTNTIATGQTGADVLNEDNYAGPGTVACSTPTQTSCPSYPMYQPVYTSPGTDGHYAASSLVSGNPTDGHGQYLSIIATGSAGYWNVGNVFSANPNGAGFSMPYGEFEFTYAKGPANGSTDLIMDRYDGLYSTNTFTGPEYQPYLEIDMDETNETSGYICFTIHFHGPRVGATGLGIVASSPASAVCINPTAAPFGWTTLFDSQPHKDLLIISKDTHQACKYVDSVTDGKNYLQGCIAIPKEFWGARFMALAGIETYDTGSGTRRPSNACPSGPCTYTMKLYNFTARYNPAWGTGS